MANDSRLTRLEVIMVEEEDLDLFPEGSLDAWRAGDRATAYALLREASLVEPDPVRRARQDKWLHTPGLWHVGRETESRPLIVEFGLSMLGVQALMFIPPFAVLWGWVWVGHEIGLAMGSGTTGTLAAFWTAVAILVAFALHKRGPPLGVGTQALALLTLVSSVGAGFVCVARIHRGTGMAEVAAPLGLVLFFGPIGWLVTRLLFGAAPDRQADPFDD